MLLTARLCLNRPPTPSEHGVASVAPADTLEDCAAGFHLGFANACLSTDYKKQPHYPENKKAQI